MAHIAGYVFAAVDRLVTVLDKHVVGRFRVFRAHQHVQIRCRAQYTVQIDGYATDQRIVDTGCSQKAVGLAQLGEQWRSRERIHDLP